jgi:hypothetical protein
MAALQLQQHRESQYIALFECKILSKTEHRASRSTTGTLALAMELVLHFGEIMPFSSMTPMKREQDNPMRKCSRSFIETHAVALHME